MSLSQPEQSKSTSSKPPRKKRICQFHNCDKVVKSQGHCQKHGAKPKRCKAPGCSHQAQGSYEGYCKRHWRELIAPPEHRRSPKKSPEEQRMVESIGISVYDDILLSSFAWSGTGVQESVNQEERNERLRSKNIEEADDHMSNNREKDKGSANIIPLAKYLEENAHLEAGWHRRAECLARGMRPPASIASQLELWEKQLAIIEIALLIGSDARYHTSEKPGKYLRMLAHAWGRDQTFPKTLIHNLCSRRGILERKKRKDCGMKVPNEKKALQRSKTEVTKAFQKCMRGEEALQQPLTNDSVLLLPRDLHARNDDNVETKAVVCNVVNDLELTAPLEEPVVDDMVTEEPIVEI